MKKMPFLLLTQYFLEKNYKIISFGFLTNRNLSFKSIRFFLEKHISLKQYQIECKKSLQSISYTEKQKVILLELFKKYCLTNTSISLSYRFHFEKPWYRVLLAQFACTQCWSVFMELESVVPITYGIIALVRSQTFPNYTRRCVGVRVRGSKR